ncbi:hypothetical protein IAU59_004321 [Kwoniella sp. CBS 9459]
MLPCRLVLAVLGVQVLQTVARPTIVEKEELMEERGAVLRQATRQQIIRKSEDDYTHFARSPFPLPLPDPKPEPMPEARPSFTKRKTVFTRKPEPEAGPVPVLERAAVLADDLA